MAGFFQSFRSSAMPKRLLRYAMARFDIFEDDALDLDNLDLGFGFKNTFEFKDVGLKVEKLTEQLGLPSEYRVKKAKVSRLQITVPLDLYSSSIELTAFGVHIGLELSPTNDTHKSKSEQKGNASLEADHVPTAADLAQSFLDTQPTKEKKALEDALATERQDLGASVSLSEDGSEDDLTYGTGQGLSLPAFLTDFLQGVVDRTRVTISDVVFSLDIEVPVEPKTAETELVALQLSLEELHVQGVTAQPLGDSAARITPKDGKRQILFRDIRASIISEADLFSSLSRSPSMSSTAPRSPHLTQRSMSSRSKPFSDPAVDDEVPIASGKASPRNEHSLDDSEDILNIPYEVDANIEGSSLANARAQEEEQDKDPASTLSTPRASIYQEFGGHRDDSLLRSSPGPDASSDPWPGPLEDTGVGLDRRLSAESLQNSDSASDDSEAQPTDDLAQSQYFSHEEAESMYMSAFSESESQRLRDGGMPGAWALHAPSPEVSPENTNDFAYNSISVPASGATLSVSDGEVPVRGSEPSTSTPQMFQGEALPQPDRASESFSGGALEGPSQAPAPSTPTGSLARLMKEVVSLDSISIYVPTKQKHIQLPEADSANLMAESTFQNIPGAFSVHASSPRNNFESQANKPVAREEYSDDSIEIHFAPLEVRFDSSVGFLLTMVIRRLLEVSRKSQQTVRSTKTPESQAAAASVPEIKFSAEKISLLFIERLFGLAEIAAQCSKPATTFGPETLLRAELEHLSANICQSGDITETKVSLERFRFGYHDSDIVAFDREAQMRASVRDTFPDAGADVSVNISTSKENSRCEINTLPLRVHVDLQRLDEAFSWFGGLSGILQMSASMTSATSQSKPAMKSSKPRGVRFDIPAAPKMNETKAETKTDARIGGLQLDLVGKQCSVCLRTTAVKVANRDGGARVQISKIQVSGPHQGTDAAPINVSLSNTRLEYLLLPGDNELDRLLALITPSKGQFNEGDDEIMVDTLLRQRRKGSVLKLTLEDVRVQASRLQHLESLTTLGEELARLGTVAKYLPEDDRPGLLTLGLIQNLDTSVDIGGRIGVVNAHMANFELAHIAFPALAAFGIDSIKVDRNSIEELIGSPASDFSAGIRAPSPVLMVRVIGDEMEPVIKVRLQNINFEYRVPTMMDVLGLASDTTPQEFDAMLAASVADLGVKAHTALVGSEPSVAQPLSKSKNEQTKPTAVSLAFHDCLLGLNPLGSTSRLAVIFIDTHVEVGLPTGDDVNVVANLRKAAILLTDDVSFSGSVQQPGPSRNRGSDVPRKSDMVSTLCSKGYVNICQISSAKATIQAATGALGETHVDVELRDDLLVLETCADSFHTLIALSGALKPPTPPSKEVKYKTQVIPVQDMLASITGDAFGRAEGDYNFDDDFFVAQGLAGGDDSSEGELVSSRVLETESPVELEGANVAENIFDATSCSIMSDQTTKSQPIGASRPGTAAQNIGFGMDSEFEVHENFFAAGSSGEGPAHRWNSAKNKYDESSEEKPRKSPLKVHVRDVHIIWNLFDGYDWQNTRDAITKTVEEVENQAFERRNRSGRRSLDDSDFEDQDVVGDCLFNSIYVSIPANHDPRELVGGINHQLDDTESVAATSVTATTTRTGTGQFRSRAKKLRLGRSRRHKITFELQGVNVDLVQFPPGSGETDTSIDVRVQNLEVFDHVPTSTWKKFATYDLDAGERELGTSMVHLELLLVKPVPELAAVEFVVKATVLPLRLHVDQDALDFIQRFFQFKDDSQPTAHSSPSDEPFIQRAEINSIPVVLDFKPKRVDYAGLRGGRTSEFMNFIILESASLTLRHTIVYGTTGWERLGNTLNDIWTPDVKKTQLAGVLAGVGPVRHLVNVGSGFRDLIEIPIKEYRRDGRIVRSIGKGAAAFARTTGTEIVKLGAKMAVGTQYVLQGAEGMLTKNSEGAGSSAGEVGSLQTGWEEEDMEPEEKKQISLYADQPTGVIQGLRHAYSSLARDLHVARDAIIAVPAEVMDSGNAQGAARAVMNRAPTIIFRPAIGATRAVGQALMGATNALDPENRRRAEDKYKSGPGR